MARFKVNGGASSRQTSTLLLSLSNGLPPLAPAGYELDMTAKRTLLASAAALLALASGQALAAPAASAAAAPDGGALFRMRCQSCHSVTPGAASPVGPNLSGVVGRKAASTTFRYSEALKKAGLTWSRPNLDRFLSGPAQMVPGTRMVIKVSNPAERAAIIAFLAGHH